VLRQQPQINAKSDKILEKKDSYIPIHERYEEVLAKAK
jgi:hypothetical protein